MKAFPSIDPVYKNDIVEMKVSFGMDLRDYFAAHIIQGLIANNSTCDNDEVVIKSAWGLADKMMKARNDS
jgi:hypothetical protein